MLTRLKWMEGDLQISPQSTCPDKGDIKYVSGLSTILVATIQEAKDRISQIEYIFCSQLYPNIQSKSRDVQKIYSEAQRATEDTWRSKENDFLVQIKDLQLQKQQAQEEIQSLKLEKEKLANNEVSLNDNIRELQLELRKKDKEVAQAMEVQGMLVKHIELKDSTIVDNEKQLKKLEEENMLLLKKQKLLELQVQDLQWNLLQETIKVKEARESQDKLLQMVEEKASMVANKEKLLHEDEEKKNLLLDKIEDLEKKCHHLESEFLQKSKEYHEALVSRNNLLQEVESQRSVIANKLKLLKENEERDRVLLIQLHDLERNADGLIEEVTKRRDLQESAFKKIKLQASMVIKTEYLLNDHDKGKDIIVDKIEYLREVIKILREEFRKKIEDLIEKKGIGGQTKQHIDSNGLKMVKNEQLSQEPKDEKEVLLARLKSLQEKVNQLEVELNQRSLEVAEGRKWYERHQQQIDAGAARMLSEKKKRKDVVASYKRLKSQLNFLCAKFGLSAENMLDQSTTDMESESPIHNSVALPDAETREQEISAVGGDTHQQKKNEVSSRENLKSDKRLNSLQSSGSCLPSTSFVSINDQKRTRDMSSVPPMGTKRSGSYWRDTRSHKGQKGPDPHDDFLNTPLENIKENLIRSKKDEVEDLPVPVPDDMKIDSSDDETQDPTIDCNLRKQPTPVPKAGGKGFKYVEPVRKKAERENLKGIECKQCKKFYDAVLPNNDGDNRVLRCEHHDGVSRHRYRYAPPMTPEGFWNIGFESEM
ncbi:DNA endonuclease activator Ctp1, C-terminal [Dillenia turbinata]|uniref:DNA endonuclease activator Ctp1, C-terminal n=1 Tax=Dillenia turbinata TaxID=194707 RepID=A0AAN8ZB59_9MAGN